MQAANKKGSPAAAIKVVPDAPAQSLVNVRKATAPAAPVAAHAVPASAAAPRKTMPKAVAEMVKQGTWEGGETVAAAPMAHKKGPPLYTAADAKKDAAAMAAAKAAMTAAEKVNAPDTVVHAKTSSKSFMQVPCC